MSGGVLRAWRRFIACWTVVLASAIVALLVCSAAAANGGVKVAHSAGTSVTGGAVFARQLALVPTQGVAAISPLSMPRLPVSDVTASVSPSVAGASQVTYTVGFTASSQGGLTAGVDGISVEFVGSPGCWDDAAAMTVTDVTSGASAIDQCAHAGYYVLPFSVAAGDRLTVVVAGLRAAASRSGAWCLGREQDARAVRR